MSRDERSLADQAASWVPPWERPAEEAVASEPVEPAVPEESAMPEELAVPAVPEEPAVPAVPEEPAVPAVPEEPAVPAVPEEPAVPAVPEEPVEPLPPAEPLQPMEPPEPAEPPESLLTADAAVPADAADAAETPTADAAETPTADGQADGQLAAIPDDELRGALEAILLVVDEPVSDVVLAQTVEQPTDRVTAQLDALAAEYTDEGRGFELRRVAGGWRLYTRPEYATYVERFVLDGQQVRLTQAALETLAVVAYKQPVTRSRISAIRGVNCDGVVRTLLARGLIEECGSEPDSGAHLYRTTTLFLERLGLDSLDQLPPLAPFLPDDVESLTDAHT